MLELVHDEYGLAVVKGALKQQFNVALDAVAGSTEAHCLDSPLTYREIYCNLHASYPVGQCATPQHELLLSMLRGDFVQMPSDGFQGLVLTLHVCAELFSVLPQLVHCRSELFIFPA